MTGRAWEAALVLLDHLDRLTVPQRIQCHVALMAGPGAAALGLIPLACSVIGARQ